MPASMRLSMLEIKFAVLVESFSMPVGQYRARHSSSPRAPDVRDRGSGYVESAAGHTIVCCPQARESYVACSIRGFESLPIRDA